MFWSWWKLAKYFYSIISYDKAALNSESKQNWPWLWNFDHDGDRRCKICILYWHEWVKCVAVSDHTANWEIKCDLLSFTYQWTEQSAKNFPGSEVLSGQGLHCKAERFVGRWRCGLFSINYWVEIRWWINYLVMDCFLSATPVWPLSALSSFGRMLMADEKAFLFINALAIFCDILAWFPFFDKMKAKLVWNFNLQVDSTRHNWN